MTSKKQHRCDTDNPQRACCWMARKAEEDAAKAREATPEWQAARAKAIAEAKERLAESFIGRGLD